MCVNFIVVPAKVYAADEIAEEAQYIEPPAVETEISDSGDASDATDIYEIDTEVGQSETVFLAPPAPVPNNISPDGQGEVLDRLANEDNIEFITITTPSGNVFYLIIDHARPNNNVYFLNSANEWDLMALAAEAELAVPPHMSQATASEAEAMEKNLPTAPKPSEPEPKAEEPAENESGGGAALFIFLAIAGAGGFGIVYYLKIYKPKKEREMYGGGEETEETETDNFEDADDADDKEGGDSYE
jgi:hypothetical protein